MESVDQLLRRIAKVGIKQAYLQRVLPEWASTYPPTSPTGLIELKVHLARNLGLDLQTLDEGTAAVAFRPLPSAPKFKRTKRQEVARLQPATAMFYALGRILVSATRQPFRPLPHDPLVIREEILSGGSPVNLPAVLDYLWDHGIPVAHYSDWPEKLSRPSAMVIDVDGRPVIIMGSPKKGYAWHLFFVSHEAGHISLGHVGRNEVLVDGDDSDEDGGTDQQEVEADAFSLCLLGGKRDANEVQLPDRSRNIDSLLKSARELARSQRIDLGHLLLRYAKASNDWDLAQLALQKVEVGADASQLLNVDRAAEQLNLTDLSEERQEFIRRVLALP